MSFFDEASRGFREQKLRARFLGPYIVTSVHKADVTCSHMVTGVSKTFHMGDLKPFIGDTKAAYDAAKTDDDQYVILRIDDYSGEPEKRTSMKFHILFEDGDLKWVDYSADLFAATPFQDYCKRCPELESLTMSEKEWRSARARYNAAGVVGVKPGDVCYVNLKAWGASYYESINLPTGTSYFVKCLYVKWTGQQRKKIDLRCRIFGQEFDWDAF